MTAELLALCPSLRIADRVELPGHDRGCALSENTVTLNVQSAVFTGCQEPEAVSAPVGVLHTTSEDEVSEDEGVSNSATAVASLAEASASLIATIVDARSDLRLYCWSALGITWLSLPPIALGFRDPSTTAQGWTCLASLAIAYALLYAGIRAANRKISAAQASLKGKVLGIAIAEGAQGTLRSTPSIGEAFWGELSARLHTIWPSSIKRAQRAQFRRQQKAEEVAAERTAQELLRRRSSLKARQSARVADMAKQESAVLTDWAHVYWATRRSRRHGVIATLSNASGHPLSRRHRDLLLDAAARNPAGSWNSCVPASDVREPVGISLSCHPLLESVKESLSTRGRMESDGSDYALFDFLLIHGSNPDVLCSWDRLAEYLPDGWADIGPLSTREVLAYAHQIDLLRRIPLTIRPPKAECVVDSLLTLVLRMTYNEAEDRKAVLDTVRWVLIHEPAAPGVHAETLARFIAGGHDLSKELAELARFA